MNESVVRQRAEAHAEAMARGDTKQAGSDLTKEAMATAPAVMKEIPRKLDSAAVTAVVHAGDVWVAHIVYRGEGRETKVSSAWEERDGRPMITALEAL